MLVTNVDFFNMEYVKIYVFVREDKEETKVGKITNSLKISKLKYQKYLKNDRVKPKRPIPILVEYLVEEKDKYW